MTSFEGDLLVRQPVSQSLLSAIREIGEHKGKQELFKRQAPQLLEGLRQSAVIRSTESSNRIEGISAPPRVIKQIVEGSLAPENRPEQEIAGYRDVLHTIHERYLHVAFTTGIVLQFHRGLYAYTGQPGGRWKTSENAITERLPDGTERVRSETVPAFRTAQAMERLHERFNSLWEERRVERLLLIPTYVVDFVCIHPLLHGNGRMARLLTLLLLYKDGYEVGRYISLEQVVEETKEGYCESLYASSRGWHESRHDPTRFWDYFLGVVLLTAYRQFATRAGAVSRAHGGKRALVLDAIERLPKHFQYADIERACPAISRPTIQRALKHLKERGRIELVRAGRGAVWQKTKDRAGESAAGRIVALGP